jgi:hypothetical protein
VKTPPLAANVSVNVVVRVFPQALVGCSVVSTVQEVSVKSPSENRHNAGGIKRIPFPSVSMEAPSLRQIMTLRQEATLVLNGLLD